MDKQVIVAIPYEATPLPFFCSFLPCLWIWGFFTLQLVSLPKVPTPTACLSLALCRPRKIKGKEKIVGLVKRGDSRRLVWFRAIGPF